MWKLSDIEFDLESSFVSAWDYEVADRIERSGMQPDRWKAAGRVSKEWPNKENGEWWQKNGRTMAQGYADWRLHSPENNWKIWEPVAGTPAIELGITVPIGGVTVKGYIDRIFHTPPYDSIEPDRLVVLDLKSGARKPDSLLQLGFYATMVELAFGIRPRFGGYYDARKGGLGAPLVNLDHLNEELLGGWLRDFVRARNDGIYIPNIGSHCNNCSVSAGCAAVNGPLASQYDPHHPDYGKNLDIGEVE